VASQEFFRGESICIEHSAVKRKFPAVTGIQNGFDAVPEDVRFSCGWMARYEKGGGMACIDERGQVVHDFRPDFAKFRDINPFFDIGQESFSGQPIHIFYITCLCVRKEKN
jgi:hypothetical protein